MDEGEWSRFALQNSCEGGSGRAQFLEGRKVRVKRKLRANYDEDF
jgi:hypothetical protein